MGLVVAPRLVEALKLRVAPDQPLVTGLRQAADVENDRPARPHFVWRRRSAAALPAFDRLRDSGNLGVSRSGSLISGATAFRSSIALANPAISSATSVIARPRSLCERLEKRRRLRGRMFSSSTRSRPAGAPSRQAAAETDAVALVPTFSDDRDFFVENEVRRGRVSQNQKNEDVASGQAGLDLRLPDLADRHEVGDPDFVSAALHAGAQKLHDEAEPAWLRRRIRLVDMGVGDEDDRLDRLGKESRRSRHERAFARWISAVKPMWGARHCSGALANVAIIARPGQNIRRTGPIRPRGTSAGIRDRSR
jgi:hypothetical protein